jgi:hypothetical protein
MYYSIKKVPPFQPGKGVTFGPGGQNPYKSRFQRLEKKTFSVNLQFREDNAVHDPGSLREVALGHRTGDKGETGG